MRTSGFVALVAAVELSSANASARGPIPYVGAGFTGFAGGGLSGLTVPALGWDLFTGVRLSKWVSIEAVYSARFHTEPYLQPEEGAMCSGQYTDRWHWQTYGERIWIHAVHAQDIDFAIALPGVGVGPLYDHGRSTDTPGTNCFAPPRDTSGTMLEVTLIGFNLEVRGTSWFGVRTSAYVTIDVGGSSLGVLAVSGSIGPVIHF